MSRRDPLDPTFWAAAKQPPEEPPPSPIGHNGGPVLAPDLPPLAPLMKIHEVAAFFRVTTRTIRNWMKVGDLHPVGPRTVLRFRREDVLALARQRNERGR